MADNIGYRTTTALMEYMTIATWDVRGINQKPPEILNEIKRRKIDILTTTETNKKAKGTNRSESLYLYTLE
jgi:exonuclease III